MKYKTFIIEASYTNNIHTGENVFIAATFGDLRVAAFWTE